MNLSASGTRKAGREERHRMPPGRPLGVDLGWLFMEIRWMDGESIATRNEVRVDDVVDSTPRLSCIAGA